MYEKNLENKLWCVFKKNHILHSEDVIFFWISYDIICSACFFFTNIDVSTSKKFYRDY